MAISPNTTFVAGAILTAAQQNQFPRGVMAFDEVIVSDSAITAEETQITGSSFTAIANRYYKVTYFEPDPFSSSATGSLGIRIRSASLAGALRQEAFGQLPTSGVTNLTFSISWVGTLTAGAQNFVATLSSSAGTAGASRSATNRAFLLVEDIGGA